MYTFSSAPLIPSCQSIYYLQAFRSIQFFMSCLTHSSLATSIQCIQLVENFNKKQVKSFTKFLLDQLDTPTFDESTNICTYLVQQHSRIQNDILINLTNEATRISMMTSPNKTTQKQKHKQKQKHQKKIIHIYYQVVLFIQWQCI